MTQEQRDRRVGDLLAGLYELALECGWRWDEEGQVWVRPEE